VDLERIPTGVPGFDDLVEGGLLRGGVYIFQGTPGAGKTIFANQLCFHHAGGGGKVVYFTLLAESHARLFRHMQAMSFYREEVIPESIYYLSAYDALRNGGLTGVVSLLRTELRAKQAGIVVLDGLVMAASQAGSEEALKIFISEVQEHSSMVGCTSLLLTSAATDNHVSPEQTMVDGIIILGDRMYGRRNERSLEIRKFRGTNMVKGSHTFDIDKSGIRIYPRLEAVRPLGMPGPLGSSGLSTGVGGLDELISQGGFPEGSVTTVAGYAGSGKTTLGLHFLSRCTPQEKGLFFGFYEAPESLIRIASTFKLDLQRLQASGALSFIWHPFGENILDALAYELLNYVEQNKVRRVFIDGMGGFIACPCYVERGPAFFAAVSNELRRLGVTTLVSVDSKDPSTKSFPLPENGISAITDNLLTLRVSEQNARVRRHISIGKVRNATYDPRIREMLLDKEGLRVGEAVDPADQSSAAK
jgi:circadian clock protein KaiC